MKSRMMGDYHVRFCERLGVKIPLPTRLFTSLRFQLVDKEKRLFQAERVVFLGFYGHDFHPVGIIGSIEDVAREYGQHLGRDSFFDLVPHGFEE